jgi:hypothetical protein
MSEWHWIIVVASAVVVYGYLCRVNMLRLRKHRGDVIAFHIAAMGAAMGAGVNAWHEVFGLFEACALIASGLWLWISWWSWQAGPPDHVASDFGRFATVNDTQGGGRE